MWFLSDGYDFLEGLQFVFLIDFKMAKKFHLTFLILIFIHIPFISLGAENDIHSWKDIGILKTTENMLLEFAGPPTSVSLFFEDYFRMKKGLNPKNQI